MIQRKQFMRLALAAGSAAAASLLLFANYGGVHAADHGDGAASTDEVADIASLYAWHTENGTIVTVLTFAPFNEAGGSALYDPEVLYGIHIDNNGDNTPDIDIWARVGQNSEGEWGLQVVNLPGASAAADADLCGTAPGHCGPVETVIDTGSNTRMYIGYRDDPFFFDSEGYNQSLTEEMWAFDVNRDHFAGLNVTALVLEMNAEAASGDSDNLQIWATTSRL
jgi:hypothetical protein